MQKQSSWSDAIDGLVVAHEAGGKREKLTSAEWSVVVTEAELFDEATGRKFCKEHIVREVLVAQNLWSKFIGDV